MTFFSKLIIQSNRNSNGNFSLRVHEPHIKRIEYEQQLKELNRIINRADLFCLGGLLPEDEYIEQSIGVLEFLSPAMSVSEILELIKPTIRYIDSSCACTDEALFMNTRDCKRMAQQVFDWMNYG